MSIDLDKVKNRLNDLKNQSNGGGGERKTWTPDEGTQKVRMVPYRYNKDYPFLEMYFHYDFPGRSFPSPKSFGDSDPIVEFAEEELDPDIEEERNLYGKLMPTLRIYAPVVIRGEEEKGVKYWGFSKTIYENLLSYLVDEEWGNFFDLEEGRDLTVERIPAEQTDGPYPETNVRPSPNRTPLADSREEMKQILDTQERIEDVFDVPSYEDIQERLDDYLAPDEEEGNNSEDSVMGDMTEDSSEDEIEDNDVDVDEITDEFSDIFDE